MLFDAGPFLGVSLTEMNVRRCRRQWSWESIGVGRSRKVRFGRIRRKPASMLMLLRLTVRVTVKRRAAAQSSRQINGLDGSLMIEWE